MKSKVLFACFVIGMLLVAGTVSMEAQTASASRQKHAHTDTRVNRTNKSRKRGKVRKVANDVGRGTKNTGKGIANGGQKAGEKVANGSEMVAEGTADGVKDASRATARGATKTGKATSKAAKKIGGVFK